jgi:hypothetical protein
MDPVVQWDAILRIAQTLALLGSIAVNCYVLWRTREDKLIEAARTAHSTLSDDFEAHRESVAQEHRMNTKAHGDLDRRVSVLEEAAKHMPTHRDLQGIQTQLSELKSAVASVDERSETTLETVQSVQRYLMEHR